MSTPESSTADATEPAASSAAGQQPATAAVTTTTTQSEAAAAAAANTSAATAAPDTNAATAATSTEAERDGDTMLIAYDGSPEARRALEYAGRFLRTPHAVIITVWEPLHREPGAGVGVINGSVFSRPSFRTADGVPTLDAMQYHDEAHEQAVVTCMEGVHLAHRAGFTPHPMLVESTSTIWGAVIEAAHEVHADMIVAGTRGMTGIKALFQPSVADNILKHSGLPVFIVPPLD